MLADAVLVLHAGFVLFVIAGLFVTWIGAALRWRLSVNPWFRGLHLAAIAFVVVESVFGFDCPLTVLEDRLRGEVQGRGFIERWLHAIMFWDAPSWVFTTGYVVFGAAVALTWLRIPPRKANRL